MKGTYLAFGVAVSLATLFGACDNRSPVTPNPLLRSQAIYSLAGTVTEPVAVPVEGAAVAVLDGPHKGKSTVTDRAGSYALIGVDGGFTIQVSKDGYASAVKGVTVTQSLTADVVIMPLSISNITGNWNVALEPESSCESPLNGYARKYRAAIVQQGAQLSITLSGATFSTPPRLSGTIHGLDVSIDLPSGCDYYYCYYGPTSPPAVIENLGRNQFLAIWGQITARVGQTGIAGSLSGELALMSSATPPFNISASCSRGQHRVTFTK
jgi:hypothetical protein